MFKLSRGYSWRRKMLLFCFLPPRQQESALKPRVLSQSIIAEVLIKREGEQPVRNYVWDSVLPYSDYLQAKSFICDVKSATPEADRDVLMDVVQNLDNCKRLPIVERIKTPGQPVDIKETCTEQESYYEDVVIRPGGFFKKAVTEKQQKTRMVTKTRIVTKCSPSSEALFEFCPIPAGSFRMGANNAKIDYDFYLGRYPVTQQQWQTVMGDNPSYFKGERLPVETVSWDDVHTFIRNLNTLTGNHLYRLPTEVEWEYACRAGSASAYYFGDDASSLGEYAWYDGNSGKTTHPVGEKKPNGWGLYDMAGNVWEWCSESEGTGSILCGGSWCNSAERSRSADRLNAIHGGRRYSRIGFRLAFAL